MLSLGVSRGGRKHLWATLEGKKMKKKKVGDILILHKMMLTKLCKMADE